MTQIAVFDPSMLSIQTAGNQVTKKTNADQDFMGAMDQAKSNLNNTKDYDNASKSIPEEKKIDWNVDEKKELPEAEPQETVETIKEEVINVEQEQPPKKVDEETLKEIQEVFAEIMMVLEEAIGADGEELKEIFEELGIDVSDFLGGDVTNLVLDIQGEENIELLTNEDLFSQITATTKKIEGLLNELGEKTKLTKEELQIVVSSLENEKAATGLDVEIMEKPIHELSLDMTQTNEDKVKEPVSLPLENDEIQLETETIVLPDTKEVKNQTDNTKVETVKDENNLTFEETLDSKVETIENNTSKSEDKSDKETKHQDREPLPAADNPKFSEEVDQITKDTGVEAYTSKADPASIMKQLADNVKVMRQNDETTMEMQLHPQSLGSVKIALTTRGGSITAQFTAQNESVKQALETQVTSLKANLEEQGVKVEAIEISVESHGLERNLDQNGQNSNEQQSREADEKLTKIRRKNINLKAWANGEEVDEEEILDEDTKLTVEMMELYGNSMDLLA